MPEDYGSSGGTTYVNTGSMGSGFLSAGVNVFSTLYNNWQAKRREEEARRQNYLYNELAAQNADARTRALYWDLYSPQAQLSQIKDAGLSPSVFYGDGGGISGQSGAQGAGPNGVSPNVYGLDPLAAAQVALTMAQTNKTKAETKNIDVDTARQEIQQEIEKLQSGKFKNEFDLLNTAWVDRETGNPTTLMEQAAKAKDFGAFINFVADGYDYYGNADMRNYVRSEEGTKNLRAIYTTGQTLARDIATLADETVSAQFHQSIVNALWAANYEQKNADAVIKQLEASIETSELTKEQRSSWNNVIDRLRASAGDNVADIIVVLSMILNNAASNWVNTNVGVSSSTTHKAE